MKSICSKEIKYLNLDEDVVNKFDDSIITIRDLCTKTRKDLKNMNLTTSQINKIIISLQLNGVDLGKKYK